MTLSLIPGADRLEVEGIFWFARFEYNQFVDADNWTPGTGFATLDTNQTLPTGCLAALPTEPVAFQTMTCQAISNDVASSMSAYTQATPPPPGGRCDRGGLGGGL